MDSIVKVKGMSCQHCVASVKKALGQIEGIGKVEIDLGAGEVRFENSGVPSETIRRAISEAGYEVISEKGV